MTTKQKFAYFLMPVIFLVSLFLLNPAAEAATVPTVLTLTHASGDAVQVTVKGATESTVQLSFLPPGAPALTTISLGKTDTAGNFSTSISSGGYAIPQGSPVFATILGVQSSMTLWPDYDSSLTLNRNSVQLAAGQSITINGSTSLILATNSQSSNISTSISGSQLTIIGLASCSGTVTVCGTNVGCSSVAVEVGATAGQTQITFSPDNPVINVRQTNNVSIFGGGNSGMTVTYNSNPTALDARAVGERLPVLVLFGNSASSVTLTVCSKEASTNCSNITVTVLDNSATTLSFSPNNLVLVTGQSQSSVVSGGTSSSYYVSSNSDSSVARATVSDNIVTVVGGTNAGSTVVKVCSTTVNDSCGNLNVTLNTSATYSANTVTFNQNIVSLAKDETSYVTITGGGGSYSVSGVSNPGIVTATISGSSNIVSLYGNAIGTSTVTICSSASGTTCASMYVTVTSALTTIVLSPNSLSLAPGAKGIVSITGGDDHTTIYSNSNRDVASVYLEKNGTGLVVTGGISGASNIMICPSDVYSSKCSTLTVTVTGTTTTTTTTTTPATVSSTCVKLLRADGDSKVYVVQNGTKRWIQTEAEFNAAGYHWSDVIVSTNVSLAAYTDAATNTPLPSASVCAILLRADGDNKVYVVKNGVKQWVKTEAEFNAAGYSWSDIVVTPTTTLAAYPDATTVILRVKVTGTPTLRVRQTNSTKGNILGSVNKDEVFTVLEQNNGWYKIKTATGTIGWISSAYTIKQ
ncbi:MAG: SH3 domain-containing protein [Patescibacteria group bacterium]|jgi:hypothetical protein